MRIREEDHKINFAISNPGPNLLIAAQGPALEFGDGEAKFLFQQRAGGTGSIYPMVGQERAVEFGLFYQIPFLNYGQSFFFGTLAGCRAGGAVPALRAACFNRRRWMRPPLDNRFGLVLLVSSAIDVNSLILLSIGDYVASLWSRGVKTALALESYST
jgi:hypothetical protein